MLRQEHLQPALEAGSLGLDEGENGIGPDEDIEEYTDSDGEDELLDDQEDQERKTPGKRKRGEGEEKQIDGKTRLRKVKFKETVIDLPSDYPEAILKHESMRGLVGIELTLREGEATDALYDLRVALITKMAAVHGKKAVKGQKANTRATQMIRRRQKAVTNAARRYRRVRCRMLALGMRNDDETFKPLELGDVRALKVYTHQEELGDSKKRPSWIWSNFDYRVTTSNEAAHEFMEDRECRR